MLTDSEYSAFREWVLRNLGGLVPYQASVPSNREGVKEHQLYKLYLTITQPQEKRRAPREITIGPVPEDTPPSPAEDEEAVGVVYGKLMRDPDSPTGWSAWDGTPISEEEAFRLIRESGGLSQEDIDWRNKQEVANFLELQEKRRQFDISQAAEQEYRMGLLRQQERQQSWSQLQAQQEQDWRTWKAERLLELERGGPVNWIKLFQLENAPSPFAMQIPSPEQGALGVMETIRETENMIKQHEAAALQALGKAGYEEFGEFNTAEYERAKNLISTVKETQKLLSELHKTYDPEIRAQQATARTAMRTGEFTGGREFEKPTTPPTPAFLDPFVQTRTGEPIRQERAIVPSGQQYGQFTPTQAQQFGGYLEYAKMGPAQNLADLQELVRQSLPQPTRGVSFRAARQRV